VLEIENLSLIRGSKRVLKDFTVSWKTNELTGLVGPSGCGKTSLFLALLGLEKPCEGRIQFKNEVFNDHDVCLEPEKRDLGVVFQNLALFPHMSVENNISFGLDSTSKSRVNEMLELFRLKDHRTKLPGELSGGERQRLALARSLAPSPRYLLLDETFSSLDPQLRSELRQDVAKVFRELNQGCLLISHDHEEVESFCDTVIEMDATGAIAPRT
jgi:iron(III) transport system ATP-binding protein